MVSLRDDFKSVAKRHLNSSRFIFHFSLFTKKPERQLRFLL